ncbi:hypothetical protein ACFLT8_01125 [Chloroflexota bacterium]
MKLIIVVIPIAMLIESIYLFISGNNAEGLILLFEFIIIGLIFWSVFPRKYQVYEDHLRIMLGGSFSVKVGFNQIEAIGIKRGLAFGINYATKLTGSHVEIAKKRWFSITITPKDYDLFVENANRALSQWIKTQANIS